jgi:xylulokinase
MAPLYLGLDVGTQGTKALVYDPAAKKILGFGSHGYGLLPSDRPGCAEQHPSTWIEGVCNAVREALKGVDASAVKAVAVSGQQHGLIVLGADGEPLRATKLWWVTGREQR